MPALSIFIIKGPDKPEIEDHLADYAENAPVQSTAEVRPLQRNRIYNLDLHKNLSQGRTVLIDKKRLIDNFDQKIFKGERKSSSIKKANARFCIVASTKPASDRRS
jgi:hypothetical protein